MLIAPMPANEISRRAAVEALGLIGTPPEPAFDDLALIAKRVCNAPIAAITLLDGEQQWLKSHLGTDLTRLPRETSFCGHAILQSDLFVVNDASLDERFRAMPFVAGAPHVRFYAGMPLIDSAGHALGTLCVIGFEPRPMGLDVEQRETLIALARQVVSLMELRSIASTSARMCADARAAAAQQEHDATHDALTGLPNRALFTRRVAEAVDQARAQANDPIPFQSALLFIDLDGFKLVNDSLGHAAGDELLRQVARRLSTSVRVAGTRGRDESTHEGDGRDVVARLGGDEFTVLLRDLFDGRDAGRVADRLLSALALPFEIEDRVVRVGGSVGITHIDGRHASATDAMREADTAMYQAKVSGKGRHVTFDDAMRRAAVARLELDGDLRVALCERGRDLRLHYQPIVSLTSGEIVGFEALVRWQHPTRGLIGPGEFVPLAEESSLIVNLGAWVIDEACRQLAEWTAAHSHLAHLSLNVNVARRQLVDPSLIPNLTHALSRTRIDPSRLKLEITESTIMRDVAVAAEAMRQIREIGVELHMDDFGTGHSSLSCLHRFELDGLKIDRSFVVTMTERRDYAAIVHAVMNLARNFNMRVTAEGIETIEQVQLLQSLECDLGQGYYFAKPLPADQAIALVLGGANAVREMVERRDEPLALAA